MHDFALLLRGLPQFRGFIIVQPAAQNLQNFAGGPARGANNEDAPELLFVLTIAPFERRLQGFLGNRRFLLFLFGPGGRLRRGV